ncbi:hypothetical protein HYU14_03615 [Candidatus Woesearchaeota archaeon]|nr:hypothetical protein [Candidatus Woesearchaeota archaeon]
MRSSGEIVLFVTVFSLLALSIFSFVFVQNKIIEVQDDYASLGGATGAVPYGEQGSPNSGGGVFLKIINTSDGEPIP